MKKTSLVKADIEGAHTQGKANGTDIEDRSKDLDETPEYETAENKLRDEHPRQKKQH